MIELLSKFQYSVPCFDYINCNRPTSYFSPLEAKSNENITLGTVGTVVQTGEFPSTVVTHRSTFVLAQSLIVRAVGSCRAVITTCPVRKGNPGKNNYDMPRVTPQTRVIAWRLIYSMTDYNASRHVGAFVK